MQVVSDLHLHSRFSRAVSSQMVLPVIAEWAQKKGIGLVATGDWTHPVWFRELKANLTKEKGLYRLKDDKYKNIRFLLSTEVSSIYSQDGETRRIHTLIFSPNFETVEKINRELTNRGANLLSDGRPIIGLSAREIAEICLSIDDQCLIIPAHIWTPWFSLYGSKSGFDSIKACFGELSSEIHAIETGLSSDPAMNWRISELLDKNVVSFSDAHSPQKLGREATVFDIEEMNYKNVRNALIGKGKDRISYTIEFYPEEGKYHYTGHRKCKVCYSPKEARKKGATCPVCGKGLTIGVMSRVESLASIDAEIVSEKDEYGVRWIKEKDGKHIPYVMLVPLIEIISEVVLAGVGSQKALTLYEQLINSFDNEFNVLLETKLVDIQKVGGERLSEAISKVRSGDIYIEPGYDGVFGNVGIWKEKEEQEDKLVDQAMLF